MLKINELSRLYLGIQGENGVRTITVDVSTWIDLYPNGSVTVWHTRCGESIPSPTGAVYDSETRTVTWDITSVDTFVAGIGEAEFRLIENEVIKKTTKVMTGVSPSVTQSGTTLGSDWQSYINAVDSLRADAVVAQEAAEDAQEAAEEAQEAAEDAQEAAEGAQTAAETAQGKAEDAQTAAEAAAARAEHASKVMVPAGGTEGQRLAKKSGADFDMEWKTDPYYTKPEGGIPATDLAEGVIPDPEDVIDDTAGAGDTDKTWSADKLTSDVLSAIDELESNVGDIANLQSGETERTIQIQYEVETGAVNSSGQNEDGDPPDYYFKENSCRVGSYIDITGIKSLQLSMTRSPDATLPDGIGNFYTYIFFYTTDHVFISRSGGGGQTSVSVTDIPSNAKYIKVSFTYTKLIHLVSSSLTGTKTTGETFEIVNIVNQLNTRVPASGVVLGDSISFGMWSYWDGQSRKNADDIYPDIDDTAAEIRISDWLANYFGIEIENIAKRGTGWVADTRNLGNAWVKAQATDFSQYDYVALCYGINDYIQKIPLGTIADNEIGTVIGNMIHVLNKVYTDNPLAKVVVFSPLNCWGQYRDSASSPKVLYGDASTHYALGYDFNGSSYTLQALIDAIESVCDRYDVRHVVMSQGCTVNVFNIKDILIDGLHPSQESMKSIASDMYHTSLFR